jgi:competence protein ComEC
MPEHVVISAGYGNRFGHPHADVIERIENREIPWSSTVRQGALLLKADSDSCSVISHRELKKRYWTAG